jgi:ketosteroid isomerase-like protein
MKVDEISAHIEIMQALYRYCRGVDRGDADMICSAYHDDAIDQHGPFVGTAREFCAYLIGRMDAVPFVGQHHITNSLIDLDGDFADVESYFLALQPEPDEQGGFRHAVVCGRYLDRFARRNGSWKIAERKVIVDVSQGTGLGAAWTRAATFLAGGRRESDPSAGKFSETA